MSTKRIISLGSGFGEVKWAEALREELPLDQAEVVHFSRENPSRLQPASTFCATR
jgi:NADH dehydrogenase FAD-containing subunit